MIKARLTLRSFESPFFEYGLKVEECLLEFSFGKKICFHQLGFSSESCFLKIHHISFNRRRRQQIIIKIEKNV